MIICLAVALGHLVSGTKFDPAQSQSFALLPVLTHSSPVPSHNFQPHYHNHLAHLYNHVNFFLFLLSFWHEPLHLLQLLPPIGLYIPPKTNPAVAPTGPPNTEPITAAVIIKEYNV